MSLELKAGDEAIVRGSYGQLELVRVERVTPTGQIVLVGSSSRYYPDGREVGARISNRSTLIEATPENRKEAQRQVNVRIIKAVKWDKVEAEKLVQIVAILQDV
jgi:hypothetical protein